MTSISTGTSKVASPFAKTELELDKVINKDVIEKSEVDIITDISRIVAQKRVISRVVEVTTKVTYTFDDGSIKETLDKIVHNFS